MGPYGHDRSGNNNFRDPIWYFLPVVYLSFLFCFYVNAITCFLLDLFIRLVSDKPLSLCALVMGMERLRRSLAPGLEDTYHTRSIDRNEHAKNHL